MRVPRTFVFVDLSGFTNFTAEFGDEEAGRILSAFRAVTREVASEHGVRIAKWLGDGCMIVAVDHVSGVAGALEIEERTRGVCEPLALRVGIATGYALLFEGDDYIGQAVNLAARLCDASGPFEVLLPADQLGELPDGVVASAHDPVELQGFPHPVQVVELSGRPTAATDDTAELWTRNPFVA